MAGGWPTYRILVSAPGPLGLIGVWTFELGWTRMGLGIGGLGTKRLGPGLDSKVWGERIFTRQSSRRTRLRDACSNVALSSTILLTTHI